MIICVSFDLSGPRDRYLGLWELLKTFEGWGHYMELTWFLVSDNTPSEIVDLVRPFLLRKDRCFAVVVREKDYQGLLPEKAWEWFKRHKASLAADSHR